MTEYGRLPRPFESKRHMYETNHDDSAAINTYPATLDGPNGYEPAVAIRTRSRVRLILTAAGAIQLANDIADLLERMDTAAFPTQQEN